MRASRKAAIAGGLGAVVLAITGLTIFRSPVNTAAEFSTKPGERRDVRLEDGSFVQLSGASHLTVTITSRGRYARLIAGEARFDIAHDDGGFAEFLRDTGDKLIEKRMVIVGQKAIGPAANGLPGLGEGAGPENDLHRIGIGPDTHRPLLGCGD